MIEQVMNLLEHEFVELMSEDYNYYKDYNVTLANEQKFVRQKDRAKNTIYIVIKFMEATLNYGQTVLPITLSAVAEQNKIEVCQKLLLEFAQRYNLKRTIDGKIQQLYTTPTVSTNFMEMFEGFRTLYSLSGTYLISENANPYDVYYTKDDGSEVIIGCATSSINGDFILDTQPFYGQNNFNSSISKVGTFSMSIAAFLIDDEFTNKMLSLVFARPAVGINKIIDVNHIWKFKCKFRNGFDSGILNLRCSTFSMQQSIGEIPVIAVTLTK